MTYPKIQIPLYYTATSLFWFGMYAYVPTLPTYAQSLGATYQMTGFILGAYGLSQTLCRIPLGILSDYIHRRKFFILFGFCTLVVSSFVMTWLPGPGPLLAARLLSGLAAATWVQFVVLFCSYFKPEDTTKAIGKLSAFCTIGQVAGMLLGGITTQQYGQNRTFLLSALAGLAGLAFGFGIIEKSTHVHKSIERKNLTKMVKDKGLLFASMLACILNFVLFSTTFGFTQILARHQGASDFELSLIQIIYYLPVVLASFFSGSVFAHRFGLKRSITWGFIIVSLYCLVLPFLDSLPLIYAAQILVGFASGILSPLLMSVSVQNIAADMRATALGIYQAVYGIGMFTGPVVAGYIGEALNLSAGFWFAGIIGCLGFILAIICIPSSS